MRSAVMIALVAAGCGRVRFAEHGDGASPGGDSDGVVDTCAPIAGSSPPKCTLATSQNRPYGLALSGNDVIWLDAGDGALRKCPKMGCNGTPTLLAMGKVEGYFVA